MTPSLFSRGRSRRDDAAVPGQSLPEGTPTPARDDDAAGQPAVGRPTTGGATGRSGRDETVGAPGAAAQTDDGAGPAEADAGATRAERVEELLESWRAELVDLGGVASLDDITVLDSAVVDLTAAHPSGLAQLYAGRPTLLSSLVRERSAQAVARQSVREVASRTDGLVRQFGVAPVYLAIGVATWNETIRDEQDPGTEALVARPEDLPARTRTVNGPVLLRPVRLTSASADAALTLDPSIEVNPVLTQALRAYRCTADVDAIARASVSPEGFTPRSALTRIAALGREYLPGFEIHERLVVGAFVHPGQALVEDLEAVADRARASAIVAALAGDREACAALAVGLPLATGEDRAPEAERGAGDLDPVQLDAVEAVGSGASIVLDAPPGSDVAATLAAILADAAASGRSILHVPATGADGHAVAQALAELGLGDLVVDLTEDTAWRRHAAEAVKTGLGMEVPDLDATAIVDMRDRLVAVRSRLSRYLTALHTPREPWGVSAYEALQQLAELTAGRDRARTTARVDGDHLARLDEESLDRARTLLLRTHELGLLSPGRVGGPWSGLTVSDPDVATDALRHLRRLSDDLLPALREHVDSCAVSTGLTRAESLDGWCEQLEMLDGVRESLDVFVPEVFERSAADMVIATATKKWRAERSVEMNGSTRRRFTRQAKDLVRPGRAVEDLHGELVKVQQRREVWRRHCPDGGWPRLPQGLDQMADVAARTRGALTALEPVVGQGAGRDPLGSLPLGELHLYVRALADDDVTAHLLPELGRLLAELDELGLTGLAQELADRQVEPERIDAELTYCWWSSLLAQSLREDPDMGGLDAEALGALASSLRELDAAQSDSLAGPVSQAVARRVRATVSGNLEEARELYRALSRDDGVPLREILARHPLALVARPVWIVPPTLVPQVLSPLAVVDLVVLDASTHVPLSHVVSSLVRGEQVVVVGDPRRGGAGPAVELAPVLPTVTLPTGRNTLDAEIAAFLAVNGYEGVVEAIPAPPGADPLSLELVDGRGMPAPGQTAVESVRAEVDRVVDLVIDHALTRPDASLGVVALNARHAEEIRRAAAQAVAGSPALEGFFSAGVAEPFVVVDLDEVRSLRRDHVILSVGYAKTPHGRTIHSFGAVSGPDGMVSLVEALCASRGRTVVVSCLGAGDIDAGRLHAPGARLLHEVLRRAAGGRVGEENLHEVPDRLLVDLAEHLWRRGLTVVPRYGVEGGLRIPLAIGHPDYPGELFVAVLTDDDAYVSEPSLRRRDRHWVERLQQRGWRVHMAFSAGVFVDPEAQARAVEDLVLSVVGARQAAEHLPEMPAVPDHVEEVEDLEEPVDGEGAGGGPVAAPVEDSRSERTARPPIAQGLPLQAYSDDQLDELVSWIRSDGAERDEEEEIEELRATLALRRRGSGIDAVLANVVRRGR